MFYSAVYAISLILHIAEKPIMKLLVGSLDPTLHFTNVMLDFMLNTSSPVTFMLVS